MNIGERIIKLRKKNNLTQEKLAELLCVSPQAVSKWERGVANPDLYLIPSIAEVFNVSSDHLLGIATDTYSRLERLEKQLEAITAMKIESSRAAKPKESKTVARWDFKSMSREEKEQWHPYCAEIIEMNDSIVFKSKAVERIVRTAIDPQLMISNISVDLTGVRDICIRLRTVGNRKNHTLQVFYVTKENPMWDELKSFKANYPNGNMVDVLIPCVNIGNVNIGKIDVLVNLNKRGAKDPLSVLRALSDTLFCGTLIGLRIDPMNQGEGYCEIESVTLIKETGEVPLSLDFSQKSDRESEHCRLYNARMRASESFFAFDVLPVGVKGSVFDPQLVIDGLSLDISRANQVHVRLRSKHEQNKRAWNNNGVFFNANLQVFFTTESSPEWSPQKCVTCQYVAGEGWFDIYADMSKNMCWGGTLTGLRIDPENADGIFEIELVEIVDVASSAAKRAERVSVGAMGETVEELEDRLDELESQYEELFCRCLELESRIDELETMRSSKK